MVVPQSRLDQVIARLRERGYRLTPQRMAVIKALIGCKEHLSVEQIYEQVRVDFPMTSLTTVYKTVAVLEEMGEVLKLGLGHDRSRYDGNPEPHLHVVCVKCRKIVQIDFDLQVLGDLPQNVAQRTGYQIVNYRFDLFGLCPQCREKVC
jgi:Fur family peroxide stress response transcriptional regulator